MTKPETAKVDRATAVTRPPAAVNGLLYDRDRDVYYPAPLLRGWAHLLFFEVSLVVGTVVIAVAHGAAETAAAAVYATTVSGLFGISALYHRGRWRPAVRRTLQRIDHVMILLLIAGSATPAFLLAAPGAAGITALAVLWGLVLTTGVCRLTWPNAPQRVVGAAYLGLGWAAGLALPAVWIRFGIAASVLLIAGGLLYTAGALVYYRRRPDPSPPYSATTRCSTASSAPPSCANTSRSHYSSSNESRATLRARSS